jgi:hypothetical protein
MKIIIFAAGVAVGYVIGSRAGRGAYEELPRKWHGFTEADTVPHLTGDGKDFAGRAAADVGDRVSETVSKVTEKASAKIDEVTGKASAKIDEVTGKSGNGSATASPAI